MSADDTPWPLPEQISCGPVQSGCPAAPFPTQAEFNHARWCSGCQFVLTDFARVAHLVYNLVLTGGINAPLPTEQGRAPAVVSTGDRYETSGFDTSVSRECYINGIKRCVPLKIFRRFHSLTAQHHIPFPANQLFLVPSSERLTIPEADVRLLTAIVLLPHMGIEGVLQTFRGIPLMTSVPTKPCSPICTENIWQLIPTFNYSVESRSKG